MTGPLCATPGCPNPVAARRGTTGRPPIYCSKACRLALRVTRRQAEPEAITAQPAETTGSGHDEITAEIGHEPDDPTPLRSWTVTIRRGPHAVTVGHGLGRFAATALTEDLRRLLHNPTNQQGGHID
jgi:hypothetical protein